VSAPQLPPGTIVAQKYQIGAMLGYGGSSATYQALGSDGREVVLKMFDPGIRQRADIMGAIEQTYAATNALPQDVAVPLLDAGYDAGSGAPFSVGERIPFPSLAQLALQRPLTPEEVLNVVNALGILLEQAQGRQLFHHALKPANIFVGFAQGYGVRITDFGAGLARAAVPTQEGYEQSAPWLAPEQVQGTAPAGAQADVFSTALVMFFALTGRSYWRACQQVPLDLPGWQRELGSPRTPPSARALQLGVQLNSAYDGVLGCALSADPDQRYRSVHELAQAFEAIAGAAEENQATMAFPAGALAFPMEGSGAAYPPPPQPSGGYQAAPPPAAGGGYPGGPAGGGYPGGPAGGGYAPGGPAGGYAAAPSPYGMPSQQNLPPPGQLATAQYPWNGQSQEPFQQAGGYPGGPGAGMAPPPQPSNAAYGSTPPPGNPPGGPPPSDSEFGETAAGRNIPAAALQRRASPNRLAPILVALVALVLLGGAAAAWVVMGKRSHPDDALASASASASASAAPVAATSVAAPADTGSAAPADTGSAATAPAAPADTAPAADADAGPAQVHSTLACDPECDEIRLDDRPIELGQPVDLTPGKHTVVASKSGFVTFKETFKVGPGDKVEKTYKLVARPTAPAGPTGPAAPPKPCGKFLKRCK